MKKKVIRRVSIISLILFGLILVVISLNYKKVIRKENTEKINGLEESEIEEKIKDDNWEISTVFYDSAVDDGKTPLTEINWDASDGGYGTGDERKITVQINYKNTGTKYSYAPGEVTINIPNLIYNQSKYMMFYNKVEVSANVSEGEYYTTAATVTNFSESRITGIVSAVSGMDWDFSCTYQYNQYTKKYTYTNPNQKEISDKINKYKFTNAMQLDQNTNFEGTIQIVYTLNSIRELYQYHLPSYSSYNSDIVPHREEFEDECEHETSNLIQATIGNSDVVKGNEMKFSYYRKYMHSWEKRTFNVEEKADKIISYDGLGEDAVDYIWVKYTISDDCYNYTTYPKIGVLDHQDKYQINIPDDCKVYGFGGYQNEQVKLENNNWNHGNDERKTYKNSHILTLYIGYPKEVYNEENGNTIIHNKVELYGTYDSETDEELLDTTDITINLLEYDFSYSGDLYEITKNSNQNNNIKYNEQFGKDAQEKWKDRNCQSFSSSEKAVYTGKAMTVRYGDDFLYAINEEGKNKD